MSFLSKLRERAEGWLGKPKPSQCTDAVKHDRFDARVFDELLIEAPALHKLVDELNERYDYTNDMIRDVLMEFWQGDPTLRNEREMHPAWKTNHAVAGFISGSQETEETRQYTVHDRYSAAMATLGVADKVKEFLERHAEEQEAAQQAAQEAEEAGDDQDSAQQCVEFAMSQAEEADGDHDAEAAAQMMLTEALDYAEQVEAEAQEAAQQAEAEQDALCELGMRRAVQAGVAQAREELEEEATLMAGWGVTDGELQKMSFEERRQLAQRLRTNRLSDFVKLIGRFRVMAAAQQTRRVEYGRDEVVGVELSGDITRIVPVEYTFLAVEELELDFLMRFAEGRLLSREYRGIERVGHGAIIACIDTSGSMGAHDEHGISREAWAKAFALALLDQARRSRRDFVGVLFSSRNQQKVMEFPKGEGSIDHVMELTEHFYGGGTDFMAPMDLAVDKLEREYNTDGKQKGDIVFITDDVCNVTPTWMRKYQENKHRLGFRTFGIQVGPSSPFAGGGDTLAAMSDNVRQVNEFADPATVADILRVVE